MRPAWLEIDLDAIRHNLAEARRRVGPDVDIIAVVKANAYAHGAERVARTLLAAGANMLALALVQEAVALREAGIDAPMLILGATDGQEAEEMVAHDLLAAVSHPALALDLAQAAQRRGMTARCHVKVDSGMGRQGVRVDEAADVGAFLRGLPHLAVEGVFSHFASSADDPEFTRLQVCNFLEGVRNLEQGLGARVPLRHTANSSGVLWHPDSWLDAVRPGGMLYGISVNDRGEPVPDLRQAMTLKARLVSLKPLNSGETVGYSRTFMAAQDTRAAVVPVGYADGYPRALSNRAEVLVRGARCPVLGRVSMDCIVIDVGGLPGVEVGEEVVLLGRQGEEMITTAELARRSDSCVEEISSRMTTRLPRVYLGDAGAEGGPEA